ACLNSTTTATPFSARVRMHEDVLAAAFTRVVTSFVSDIVSPLISLLPFLHRNLDEKFAVLRRGPHYSKGQGYNTLKQARDDGALVMAYGAFLDNVLNFIGVGIALYAIAQVYAWVSDDSIIKHTVKCKFCRKSISEK
ncbi:Anditomin synthesis protein L, partial [Cryomyces minteri]